MNRLCLKVMACLLCTLINGFYICKAPQKPPATIYTQLNKHITFLYDFNEKNKKKQLINWDSKTAVPFLADCDTDCKAYKHPLVILCVKKMIKDGDIRSLVVTWSVFLRSYKEVESELFVREISMLLFCLYKNILLQCDNSLDSRRVALPDVLSLHGKVSLIPFNEIIVALNHCYIVLTEILKEYEFSSSMSWVVWFDKYWWVPPTVLFSVLYHAVFYQTLYHGAFNLSR